MDTPFVFFKKKNVKKSVQKKIGLIFCSSAGFEPAGTAKCKLSREWSFSCRSHDVVLYFDDYNQVWLKKKLQPLFKKAGTRTHNYLGANFWLVVVVLYRGIIIQVQEPSGTGKKRSHEVISENLPYLRNFRGQKNFFLHAKKIFFFNFLFLIPVKTFKYYLKEPVFNLTWFSILVRANS